MLTRNEILRLKSLHTSKGRKLNNSVLIEGFRLVEDCLNSTWEVDNFYITESSFDKPQFQSIINLIQTLGLNQIIISEKDMTRIASTKSPQGIALEIPVPEEKKRHILGNKIIYLDNISDPGNLGTIIRTAVWFGVDQIILSENCVSVWNSKVLRSGMGAHFKIQMIVQNLSEIGIENTENGHQIIGATMDGIQLEQVNPNLKKWILILGCEAHGLNSDLERFIHQKITINGSGNQESLNVAVASGIILNYLNG